MKKFLSLFCLIAIAWLCSVAYAETVDDVLTASKLNVSSTSYTDFTDVVGPSGAVYAGKIACNKTNIQLNKTSPNGIVTTTSGGKVKKIKINWATNIDNAKNRKITVYGKNTPYNSGADLYGTETKGKSLGELTYTTSATTASLDITGDYNYIGLSASGAMYCASITITWEVPNVKNPQYTLDKEAPYFAGDKMNVTLSCATEGATIYYTTDNSEPSADNGTQYSDPFEVGSDEMGDVVVKAIAVKDAETSNVAKKQIKFNRTAKNVTEFNTAAVGELVRIGCDLTISYAHGSKMFAQDAEGKGMYLYSSKTMPEGAENGKLIPANGIKGVVATYLGNTELNFTNYSVTELKNGTKIEPTEVEFDALSDDVLYHYVKVPNVTLLAAQDANYEPYYSVNGIDYKLTNEFNLERPKDLDGKFFDIYGIYAKDDGLTLDSRTIFFISAEEVVAAVAAPTVSKESGTYDDIMTVTMKGEEGAEVRYSFDPAADFENGKAGTDYIVGTSVTIDKTCTLTAVAVKDGIISPSIVRNYVMKTETPTISLVDDTKVVTITTKYDDNIKIYYTLDGSAATTESALYAKPFVISQGEKVNALAQYGEFDVSEAATPVEFQFNTASVTYDASKADDFNGKGEQEVLDNEDFIKDPITISFAKEGSNENKYYPDEIRFYKGNKLTISAVNTVISSVEFITVEDSKYKLETPTVSSGSYSIEGVNGKWICVNAKSATLVNVTQQARIKTIKVSYVLPDEAASVTAIKTKGALYTVNFELNGQVANGGVLYARTTDTSVEASKPDKDYFDKSYEDYDWEKKYDQRDWVAINGNTELVGKTLATGFIARYDGVKLTPVAAIEPKGDAASYKLNTFGVANVFYGNNENTENVMGGYKPFFVKAKVNEVANYVGEVKEVTGGLELWGSGVCGKLNNKGLKIDANGIEITASAEYQQIEGVLVADAEANGGVKLVALSAPTTPTGVAALKADGKATVYGTEGAVVVNGADGKVMIFDAMGRMVKSVNVEGAATVAMPAGYYIVRTAGSAAKVMVK